MEKPRRRRGCLGCFTVVLVLVVLLVGWVAAVRWGLLEKLGLRQPIAEQVFAPPPDREAAAAITGMLQQSGMDMRGVDVYVLPMAEGGSVALLSLDASQGFDPKTWLNSGQGDGVDSMFDESALQELGVTRLAFDYVDSEGRSIVTLTAPVDALRTAGEGEMDQTAFLKALKGNIDIPGLIREVTP